MFVKSELPLVDNNIDPLLSVENGATEVYLIRHANALPAAAEVANGGYDDQSLSDLGRSQSKALAERMRKLSIAAIYSSPIKRTWQTAATVGDALGLEVQAREELREVGLAPVPAHLLIGEPEERATAIHTYLRDLESVALQIGIWSQIPGSEPSQMIRGRITSAINQIVCQHLGKRIAIVTHSGAINAYIATILGLDRDFFFPADYTSISVVRVKGQHHLLIRLNDTAHLQ